MKIIYDTMLPREWFDRLNGHELIPDTEYCPDAEVLTTNFYKPVRKDKLDQYPKLRLITQFGVGYDNIDVAECHKRGILVTNTPQPVIEPTAELCMALIMGIARRISELDRGLRLPGQCRRSADGQPTAEAQVTFGLLKNLGHSLYGKTLGIIGMGNIGRSVARRAIANGMKIIYHNRHRIPESVLEQAGLKAEYVTFEDLLQTADFVSLNLPYTAEVHHLIGERELNMMKQDAFLINTARGAHLDEKALVNALREHRIAGAALDVYEHEPQITPELKELDNVLLLPHIGTGTWEGRKAMCDAMIDNILAYANNEPDKMTTV